MSNSIGLHCGDPRAIIEKIGSYEVDCEDADYEFPFANALGEGHDTDAPLADLGAVVEAHRGSLSADADRSLSSFTLD